MPERERKSLSRQHVLAPEHRTRVAAFPVVQKLLHSAAAELRRLDLWTGDLAVKVKFLGGRKDWHAHRRLAPCRDSFQMQSILAELWKACPDAKPILVAVALSDLTASADAPPALFTAAGEQRATRANAVMDDLNRRFGAQTLLPASLHTVRNAARPAIGFRRTPEFEDLE